MNQITIFDELCDEFSVTKPIRLIELFAGYGSQAMALKKVGAKFEHYRVVEFDKFAIASYNAVHGTDFPTIDIKKYYVKDYHETDYIAEGTFDDNTRIQGKAFKGKTTTRRIG